VVRLREGPFSIKCSLHGSYFDLATGLPVNEPADCPLMTYPTKVEGRAGVGGGGLKRDLARFVPKQGPLAAPCPHGLERPAQK
jgi:hypothetical protein